MAKSDTAAHEDLVKHMSLLTIDTAAIEGRRIAGGPSDETRYEVATGYAFSSDNNNLVYRMTCTADILQTKAPEDQPAAKVEVQVIAAFEIADGFSPDTEAIVTFGARELPAILVPYLRESVSAVALRLGYPGVHMPLMTRDATGSFRGFGD